MSWLSNPKQDHRFGKKQYDHYLHYSLSLWGVDFPIRSKITVLVKKQFASR